MSQPHALPLQLYLLGYDTRRRCFAFDRARNARPQWMFEFALRSAMFTDLYLSGAITDDHGVLSTVAAARVSDPFLGRMLSMPVNGRTWADLICSGGRGAVDDVRGQLERLGWIELRRRTVGAPQVKVRDTDPIETMAFRVVTSLQSILEYGDAEPRSLALGLIAFQAQMPVVEHFLRHEGMRHALHELTEATIEPIHALRTLILLRLAEIRACGGP